MSASSQPAAPESATVALYRAALGPVNTAHYLEIFDRFDHAGRTSPVWNPAAGLLTLNWLVFRQLWGTALMYLACVLGTALLLLVVARGVLQWPPAVEWGVLLALLLLSIALPGAYGTALLHADTRRRMTHAVKAANTVREACATLEKQASTRRRLWTLAVLNLLLAGAAAVAAYLEWRPAATAPAAALSKAPERPSVPASSPAPAEPVPDLQAVADQPPSPAEPAMPPAAVLPPEPPPVIVSPPVLPPPTAAETAPPPEPPPAPVPPPPPSPPPSPARATLVDRPSLPAPAPAKPAPPPKPAPAMPAAAAPQAHGINVGLFSDPANAEKAHARLVEAGFPAILQKVESASGERTRVRVGPFAGRAQAEEAAARIRAMGLDAVVFAP